jgi:hypothetical protein
MSTNSPTWKKQLLHLGLLTSEAGVAVALGIIGTTTTTTTASSSSSSSDTSNNGTRNGNDAAKTPIARMDEFDFDDLFV